MDALCLQIIVTFDLRLLPGISVVSEAGVFSDLLPRSSAFAGGHVCWPPSLSSFFGHSPSKHGFLYWTNAWLIGYGDSSQWAMLGVLDAQGWPCSFGDAAVLAHLPSGLRSLGIGDKPEVPILPCPRAQKIYVLGFAWGELSQLQLCLNQDDLIGNAAPPIKSDCGLDCVGTCGDLCLFIL